jgi:hypothetical protein
MTSMSRVKAPLLGNSIPYIDRPQIMLPIQRLGRRFTARWMSPQYKQARPGTRKQRNAHFPDDKIS